MLPTHFSQFPQAPNAIGLEPDKVKGGALDKYKADRKDVYAFRAASRLWMKGISMAEALDIVNEAFDEVFAA